MRGSRDVMARRHWLTGAALAVLLSFSACANSNGEALPDYDPAPSAVESPAAETDREPLRLPLQFHDVPVVDPGWQTPPQYADDVFLSATHAEDVLTFRAVDSTGSILWEADRPLSCTGFTLTSNEDASYAVLTDIDADVQGFGNTVASAYDLHTGDLVWGPVDVPGPHHGPGTVFAAPTEEAMGESGPKVVLDPASGEILVGEREHDVTILGEFHGTILLINGEEIQAHTGTELAASGPDAEPLWTLQLEDFGWSAESLTAKIPAALTDPTGKAANPAVLLGTTDSDRALVDLTDATVLAEGLSDAGQDPTSQTWVTIGDTLTGYDPTGQKLYEEPNTGLKFRGIGAAIAYLENSEGDLEARNVVTGKLSRSYDSQDTGTLTVPEVVTANGAGVLEADGRFYLATVPTIEQPAEASP